MGSRSREKNSFGQKRLKIYPEGCKVLARNVQPVEEEEEEEEEEKKKKKKKKKKKEKK